MFTHEPDFGVLVLEEPAGGSRRQSTSSVGTLDRQNLGDLKTIRMFV